MIKPRFAVLPDIIGLCLYSSIEQSAWRMNSLLPEEGCLDASIFHIFAHSIDR